MTAVANLMLELKRNPSSIETVCYDEMEWDDRRGYVCPKCLALPPRHPSAEFGLGSGVVALIYVCSNKSCDSVFGRQAARAYGVNC